MLKFHEAVQERPGMYLGATDRLAGVRLVGIVIDVIARLTARLETPLLFPGHAFLDVGIIGRDVDILLDFSATECPDILDRCEHLVGLFESTWERVGSDTLATWETDFFIAKSLAKNLCISRSSRAQVFPIIGTPMTNHSDTTKDTCIRATFHIKDQIDLDGLSDDYLKGFVQGSDHARGLVLRQTTVST